MDRAVSEIWGRLNVPDPLPSIDGLLAATARAHRLTLVTRNVKDVAPSGVPCLNPFDGDRIIEFGAVVFRLGPDGR